MLAINMKKIEFGKRIIYQEDLVEYLCLARQNLLVVSSNVLFEKSNLEVCFVDGKINITNSNFNLHENFMKLLLKSSWENDEVKIIVGYVAIINLLSTTGEDSDITRRSVYTCVTDIVNGAWKSAYASKDDIESYRNALEKYNAISAMDLMLMDLNGTAPNRPENPLEKSMHAIYGIEKIMHIENPIEFAPTLKYYGDIMAIGKGTAGFLQNPINTIYWANVELPEYIEVDEEFDDGFTKGDVDYRRSAFPGDDGDTHCTIRYFLKSSGRHLPIRALG